MDICRGICVQTVGRRWESVCVQVCMCTGVQMYAGGFVCVHGCLCTWMCVYRVDVVMCWSVCIVHKGYAGVPGGLCMWMRVCRCICRLYVYTRMWVYAGVHSCV